MYIKPIPTTNPAFGIYLKTTPKHYGHITHGVFKGNSIDIYTAYEGSWIRHKFPAKKSIHFESELSAKIVFLIL